MRQLIAFVLLVAHVPLAYVAGAGPPADNTGGGDSDAAASAAGSGGGGGGGEGGGRGGEPRRPAQRRVRPGLDPPNHPVFPGDAREYWPYGVERWGEPIRPLAECLTAVSLRCPSLRLVAFRSYFCGKHPPLPSISPSPPLLPPCALRCRLSYYGHHHCARMFMTRELGRSAPCSFRLTGRLLSCERGAS